jgi:hypothetical protein
MTGRAEPRQRPDVGIGLLAAGHCKFFKRKGRRKVAFEGGRQYQVVVVAGPTVGM